MSALITLIAQLEVRAIQLQTEADGIEQNGEVPGSFREAKTLRVIGDEFHRLATELSRAVN